MAQPQKQPVLAAYLLTMVMMVVMLVVAVLVTGHHAGAMPSLMGLDMLMATPAAAGGP